MDERVSLRALRFLVARWCNPLLTDGTSYSGPGASSTGYGNLMELGPCLVTADGSSTYDNPYSWNANATVLFVE